MKKRLILLISFKKKAVALKPNLRGLQRTSAAFF
jgi:hypothetical protein